MVEVFIGLVLLMIFCLILGVATQTRDTHLDMLKKKYGENYNQILTEKYGQDWEEKLLK